MVYERGSARNFDLWRPSCHNTQILQLRADFYMFQIFLPHTTMNILLDKKYFSKLKSCSCWVTKRFERFKDGLIWSKVDISIVIGFAIWHLYRTKNNCLNLILASHCSTLALAIQSQFKLISFKITSICKMNYYKSQRAIVNLFWNTQFKFYILNLIYTFISR